MRNDKLVFRYASKADVSLILKFIKELALYEKMLDEVVATEELLKEWLFEKNKAEVIFAVENNIEVGFALFFHNFSTFLGRAGIYVEDLFVMPEHRGKGYETNLALPDRNIIIHNNLHYRIVRKSFIIMYQA